ncbi:MAG: hypothetical protein H0T79_12685 [Deltaproteobacteria bacterium]|nr:hypothetical protein [Deltaproteobacteria bacterium]
MAFIDALHANNVHSSPGPMAGDLTALMPLALAFLSLDRDDASGYASLKSDLRRWAKEDPIDALFATVVGGGLAFYLAEHERNPACANPWDAILYMSTCLSVGYDNLFPVTSTGHALAALVQAFGPALSERAFDEPAAVVKAAADEAAAVNRAILARLEDIVRLLEAR